MEFYTTAQMKEIERNADQLGVSYLRLMENAGTACAAEIISREYLINKSVVILCGHGNNGGDGFVIARKLFEEGANVIILLCKGQPQTKIAHEMFSRVEQNPNIAVIDNESDLKAALFYLIQADCIIDCIFGTGFRGNLSGIVGEFLQYANNSHAVKYAVDIPSGMQGDTGRACENTFEADMTLVLGAYKTAHGIEQAQRWCGDMKLLDIGIPQEAFFEMDFKEIPYTFDDLPPLLPERQDNSHKGDYGRLLNIAGCNGMGGAAMMSTLAAMRCGAGLTVLATTEQNAAAFAPQLMEAITLPLPSSPGGGFSEASYDKVEQELTQATACLLGCGMGQDDATEILIRTLLSECKIPLILDADGINAVAQDINILQKTNADIILTPHPREFSRLCGKSVEEIEANRVQESYRFAKQYGVILVLKGHQTVIALPDGTVYRNIVSAPALAKGGSGDVLAGMIGSFAAQGLPLADCARLAVCIHANAGSRLGFRLSSYGVLARDVIEELPRLLRELEQAK